MVVSPDMRAAAQSVMPDVVSVALEPLAGGSSAFVAVLVLESAAGVQRRVVFRQHTDRTGKEHNGLVASKEFHLTQELAGEGLAVARPLALHGSEACDGPWLVSEWVEGTTHVAAHDLDSALLQMGDYLARLHHVKPDRLSAPGIAQIEDPVEALPEHLLDDQIGRSIKHVLSAGVERRPNPSVLLHGDFWPGNVMFESGRLVAVVDWEDAKWGDPLVDLACARVELACAYGAEASGRFTASYLASNLQLDEHDLPLWDIYVSSTALSAMHRWGLSPGIEAARRRTTGHFLEAAFERLIAI
ncbi:MAG: phosphotransferase family protein [Ilumatobacter sp.]